MSSTQGIRAGRAFVELFTDDSKLVRGLRNAQKRIKAFGDRIRGLGLNIAGLGTAMLTPMLGAAKVFSSFGDQVAKMAKRTGLSVGTLSELRFVASQTGTEFESLEMGFPQDAAEHLRCRAGNVHGGGCINRSGVEV